MKAILVIDLPSYLDISLEDIKTEITLSSKDETKSLLYLKYGRVKLKSMPQKRILPKEQVEGTNYGEEPWFSDGFNACIDEILGEEE